VFNTILILQNKEIEATIIDYDDISILIKCENPNDMIDIIVTGQIIISSDEYLINGPIKINIALRGGHNISKYEIIANFENYKLN